MRRSRGTLVVALCSGALLAGCTVGPDYERPELDLPEEWPEGVGSYLDEDTEPEEDWWRAYGDETLDELVKTAQENNLDTRIAAERVAEARAALGFARAERYPTLDAQAEVVREDDGAYLGGGPDTEIELTGVLGYEVDLWGRLSREGEAAQARLLASAFSRDALELAVTTEVVTTYYNLRAVQDQIRITEDTIETRAEALELEQSRYDSGASSELALRQAEAELETTLAQVPELRGEAANLRRSLAILVGEPGQTLTGVEDIDDDPLPTPELDEDLPETLPSDLLERRPDIRAAESELIAANADIGAVRASWFPRLDLLGVFGTGAASIGNLFTGPATIWEVGAVGTASVLDFGRREASEEGAEAAREIAELQYRSVIREAFREAGDAWTLLTTASDRLAVREREVEARLQVVDLAESRYLGGQSPYVELLDARRSLLEAQLARSEAARDRLVAVANLYKALGGGWERQEVSEFQGLQAVSPFAAWGE